MHLDQRGVSHCPCRESPLKARVLFLLEFKGAAVDLLGANLPPKGEALMRRQRLCGKIQHFETGLGSGSAPGHPPDDLAMLPAGRQEVLRRWRQSSEISLKSSSR